MRIAEWLSEAEHRLSRAGVDSPLLDAQLIAAHALGMTRAWVVARPETEVFPNELEGLLQRREKREPLAYILGIREFYGRIFHVSSDVLIPRHETETLIDAYVDLETEHSDLHVLDLGTGSGCIGITLKLECPNIEVSASDISEKALHLAEENAKHLKAHGIKFVQSDGFLALGTEWFGAIVTNPPYVGSDETLMHEVGGHEPAHALYSGPTGLEFFEMLAAHAAPHLLPGGFLLTEIGDHQAEKVHEIFKAHNWEIRKAYQDLNHIERALAVKPILM